MLASQNKLVRILHVTKYASRLGGIERYLEDLVRHQRGSANSVEILAVASSGELIDADQHHLVRSWFTFASAPITPSFVTTYARLARQVDIVHFHGPNPIAELSCLVTPRSAATLVASYHADVSPEKPLWRAYRYITAAFLRRVDGVIAASPTLAGSSPMLRRLRDKTTVIPYGIDVDRYRRIPRTTSARPANLLFVGRLIHYKGVAVLLRALQTVKDVTLRVVGSGPLEQDLTRLCTSLDLDARVTFVGRISDEALLEEYRSADALVLPSVTTGEAFGYVLVEAMAAGCAVISTELGSGTSWVNQDGVTGRVVPPKDPEALAAAISWVLSDAARLRSLQQAAATRARTHFDRSRMFAETDKLYHALRLRGSAPR